MQFSLFFRSFMFHSLLFFAIHTVLVVPSFAQDVELTPEMYEFSPFSVTGVYLCTPRHVESGDCTDVDKEYFDNMARLTLGVYEVGILTVNHSRAMAFKGPLSPGSAQVLIGLLKSHPDIETLVLSSQGGSEEEAAQISEYVQSHHLKTWVPARRMCLSACVSIFLSGSEMTLDGLIGLHTGSYFLSDNYKVRNLEAAKETIDQALYENNKFMMNRVRLFLKLNLDLHLIEAMNEARGEFLIFTSLTELFSYDKTKNYVLSLDDALIYSKGQEYFNFDFQSYEQLF